MALSECAATDETTARDEDGVIPEAQIFRLEGPGAVIYFRGCTHVHAFINIAMRRSRRRHMVPVG